MGECGIGASSNKIGQGWMLGAGNGRLRATSVWTRGQTVGGTVLFEVARQGGLRNLEDAQHVGSRQPFRHCRNHALA
ncbi:hypothetical protein SE17_01935 [Kouleothrix aurantiaca]|uniref:Uncharacterized protein n=1 Tax=Kouleothrix aurantiaca TaxID=186479 RepID=A0A0N8PT72_9CHLR|nr:hypothetical protein SE17_01935 [Kouleothrix aurantiaca]